MGAYIVLSKLTAQGAKSLRGRPEALQALAE